MLTRIYFTFHLTISIFILEYGTILAEITVDPNESPARRQLAAVLLKQYVDTHWSIHSEKFTPPEVTNHVSSVYQPKYNHS